MNIKLERAMWKLEERLYPIVPKPLKIILKKREVERYSFETRKVGGEWCMVNTCFSCGEEIGLTSIKSIVQGKKLDYGMYCIPCGIELSKR